MPRYYFDMRDGSVERDLVGVEFAEISDARKNAVKFLGEVLKDDPERAWAGDALVVQVSDEQERPVFSVKCVASDPSESWIADFENVARSPRQRPT